MYRNNAYEEDFARDMRDPEARQEFLSALIHDKEEPLPVEDALKIVIQRMGVSEFSKLVEAAPQNIDKFLKGERNPKRETLDRFLKPFGLKTVLSVKPLDKNQAA
jgi:DNA-binding phage protein